MKLLAAFALALLAVAPASAQPRLDMLAFFSGKTHAEGVLKIAMKKPVRMVVDTVGGRNKAGEFVLIDTIREEGQPVRIRKWVMRPAGPDRYTGALSDAVGPVSVAVEGSDATIRYTMKGGLKVEQRMRLQGDGKTLSNKVIVKKFGLKFARMDGMIRKVD